MRPRHAPHPARSSRRSPSSSSSLPAFVNDFRAQQFAYVGIYLVALIGLDILTGYTGQISLGHGAFMAIGGYTTAILMTDHGVKDIATIPLAIVVAGIAGVPLRASGRPPLGPLPRARDVRDRGRHARRDQEVRGVHRRRLGDQPVRHAAS